MKPLKFVLLTGLALVLSMPMAFAGPGNFDASNLAQMRKMLKKLDLSEEQKQTLASIRKQTKEEGRMLTDQLREARRELAKAFANDASDAEIRASRANLASVMKQLGDQRFENIMKIRKVLTPEQKKQFQKMRIAKMRKLQDSD